MGMVGGIGLHGDGGGGGGGGAGGTAALGSDLGCCGRCRCASQMSGRPWRRTHHSVHGVSVPGAITALELALQVLRQDRRLWSGRRPGQ